MTEQAISSASAQVGPVVSQPDRAGLPGGSKPNTLNPRPRSNRAQIASAIAGLLGIVFGIVALFKSSNAVKTAEEANALAQAANELSVKSNETAKDANEVARVANRISGESNKITKDTNEAVSKLTIKVNELGGSVAGLSSAIDQASQSAEKSNKLAGEKIKVDEEANRLAKEQGAVAVVVEIKRAATHVKMDAWDIFERQLDDKTDKHRFDNMKARMAVHSILNDQNTWTIAITNAKASTPVTYVVLSIGPLTPKAKLQFTQCGSVGNLGQPVYVLPHSTNCVVVKLDRAEPLPPITVTGIDLLKLAIATFKSQISNGKRQQVSSFLTGDENVYLTVLASDEPRSVLYSSENSSITSHTKRLATKWQEIRDDPDGDWFMTPINSAIRDAKPAKTSR